MYHNEEVCLFKSLIPGGVACMPEIPNKVGVASVPVSQIWQCLDQKFGRCTCQLQ